MTLNTVLFLIGCKQLQYAGKHTCKVDYDPSKSIFNHHKTLRADGRRNFLGCGKASTSTTIPRTLVLGKPRIMQNAQRNRFISTKGQLISKVLFGILNSSKKETKNST